MLQRMELISVKMQNFLGVSDRTINFGEKETTISGANEIGKTTSYNSITWLFFNKDVNGNELKPRPVDADGNLIHKTVISVEAVVKFDGEEFTLEKTQREQWSREAENKHVTGNPNSFKINGIEQSQTDFNKFLKKYIDENVFMYTFVAGAFNRHKNSDRRKTLMSMLSNVSDDEIIAKNPQFKYLKGIIGLKPLEEIIKGKKSAAKDLEKKKEALSTRLQEQEESKVTFDTAPLEKQKADLQAKIAEIQEKMKQPNPQAEMVKQANERIMQIAFEKSEIQRKANEDLISRKSKLDKEIYDKQHKWDELQLEQQRVIRELNVKIDNAKQQVDTLNGDIEKLKLTLKDKQSAKQFLLEKYHQLESKSFDRSSAVCPTCGKPLDEDKVDELETKFNSTNKEEISSIVETGKELKKEIEETIPSQIKEIEDKIKKTNDEITELEKERTVKSTAYIADKDNLHSESAKLEAKLNALPPCIDVTSRQDYNALEVEEQELQDKISGIVVDNSAQEELINEQNRLQAQIDEINRKLSSLDKNKAIDERISQIKQEQLENAQQIANIQKELHLLNEFKSIKANEVMKSVNDPFQVVKWKLFDVNQKGEDVDVCKCMIDGVSYDAQLNHGNRIQADIDIIQAFQKLYNVKLPVFIDDCESIDSNKIPQLDTQVIKLVHVDGGEWKVETK